MAVLIDTAAFTPWTALAGGALIGLAAVLNWWALGRLTGISHIAHRSVAGPNAEEPVWDWLWRPAFLLGLLGGGLAYSLWGAASPSEVSSHALAPGWLIVGGLLVGWGTAQGHGCTSGHGVCGLGRRSVRSLAATLTFMASGALTVYLVRHVWVGA